MNKLDPFIIIVIPLFLLLLATFSLWKARLLERSVTEVADKI
nr:hypothetical protein [uncultured Glaciecola sp.]